MFRLTPIDLGNGFSISGTVTTDGALGALGPVNFTQWNITVKSLTEFTYTRANSPASWVSQVATDGQRITVSSSDGIAAGGALSFGPLNPRVRYRLSVADFGRPFLGGGQAMYPNGADFQYLPLNQPDGTRFKVAQAQSPGSRVCTLNPVDFDGGVTLSGNLTTDGTVGELTGANLTDWNIKVSEVTSWRFNERNTGLLNYEGVGTDGRSITVATPYGNWAFGAPGGRGGGPTIIQLADFTDPSLPGGQAGYIDPFNYLSAAPLSGDASYVASRAIPEPAQAGMLTGWPRLALLSFDNARIEDSVSSANSWHVQC